MAYPSPIVLINESGYAVPVLVEDLAFLTAEMESEYQCIFAEVELVYVNETEIVRINKEFLGRDYITDIISFRYDENTDNNEIDGSLICCAPRIAEQATEFNQPEKKEFLRIFVHGMLHLIGYDDQTEDEKREMTRLEDHFLNKLD